VLGKINSDFLRSAHRQALSAQGACDRRLRRPFEKRLNRLEVVAEGDGRRLPPGRCILKRAPAGRKQVVPLRLGGGDGLVSRF
jgi:hypothetical protein